MCAICGNVCSVYRSVTGGCVQYVEMLPIYRSVTGGCVQYVKMFPVSIGV